MLGVKRYYVSPCPKVGGTCTPRPPINSVPAVAYGYSSTFLAVCCLNVTNSTRYLKQHVLIGMLHSGVRFYHRVNFFSSFAILIKILIFSLCRVCSHGNRCNGFKQHYKEFRSVVLNVGDFMRCGDDFGTHENWGADVSFQEGDFSVVICCV